MLFVHSAYALEGFSLVSLILVDPRRLAGPSNVSGLPQAASGCRQLLAGSLLSTSQ